jgi:uncharacterized iron-regulated protein
MRFHAAVVCALAVAGCASGVPSEVRSNAAVLLVGEQHDAPGHPAAQRRIVDALVPQARLAALVLEMSEQGASTAHLPATATEAEVRQALRWNNEAWPWERYAPAVMAAVRAGAPVLGGNLPREKMRAAMGDAQLDAALPPDAWHAQQEAIRSGHCGLLPESQIAPMTRIQVARDRAMADTLRQAAVPGKTVVLVAGSGHVDAALGVPRHLPAALGARPVVLAPEPTGKDYCGELRRRMAPQG